jgi:hypothetical protein
VLVGAQASLVAAPRTLTTHPSGDQSLAGLAKKAFCVRTFFSPSLLGVFPSDECDKIHDRSARNSPWPQGRLRRKRFSRSMTRWVDVRLFV